jgi:pyruvate dehydrogenase E1 component
VVSYDPAYAYEIGHIVRDGLRRMYGESPEDVYYYLTVYNEPYVQPAEPEGLDVDGVLRGMYLLRRSDLAEQDRPRGQILASGVAVPWALEAQQLLRDDWGVAADVWSVTSWNELRRDALRCDEQAFGQPGTEAPVPYVTQKLSGAPGPVVAVSDYMRQVPDQIRQWVTQDFASLGTDGFGFSDTRPAARRFFTVDGPSITTRLLLQLARRGEIDPSIPGQAVEKYRLHDIAAGTTGSTGGEA